MTGHCAAFLLYVAVAVGTTLVLIWVVPSERATTNIFIYVAICSIVGSLSVVSCKASTRELLKQPCLVALVCAGHNEVKCPPGSHMPSIIHTNLPDYINIHDTSCHEGQNFQMVPRRRWA